MCRSKDIEIISGHIRPDHVHMLISAPPSLAPSCIVQAIKDFSASRLQNTAKGILERTVPGTRLLHCNKRECNR
ncbi:hypothetical protein CSA37_12530 [Candidatus Fermentibacteria bacterium]|nr:MAG: hypothetical protein CSA37_12530 [Candidatus Fermentibacteria bacterium]